MMNKRINLLVPEKHDPVLEKRIRILRIISLSFLGVIVLSSVGLFLLILASPLPSLRSEEAQVTAELRTKQKKMATLYLLRERLGGIEGIISSRKPVLAITKKVSELLPANVQVDHIVVEQSTVSITVSSNSLLLLNSSIEDIKNLKNEKLFSSIALSNVTYEVERQAYTATLALR